MYAVSFPVGQLLTRCDDGQLAAALPGQIVAAAMAVLNRGIRRECLLDSPTLVKRYLCAKLGSEPHEIFAVLFLDVAHRLIEYREMFRGTLTQTSVYPREVVKEALALNAAAVMFAHNHPSGLVEPSRADEYLTELLKTALATVEVKVLDHIVVAGGDATSFAERGLL